MIFLLVVCKLGAADDGLAGDGDGSKNLGQPISRTARATSEQKFGRRKPTKTKKHQKQNGNKKNKPTRAFKNNNGRSKKKLDGKNKKIKGKKKGGEKNKKKKKKQNSRRIQKKKKNNKRLQRKEKKRRKNENNENKSDKQKAKERRKKERKRKKSKLPAQGRNSSSTGCPDLVCINNAGTALKLEKDQISNFIKQKSRVENYMKTVNGKLGKKGQFEADAASLKSALGGNLDNATCGGSTQRTVSAAAKVSVKHSSNIHPALSLENVLRESINK